MMGSSGQAVHIHMSFGKDTRGLTQALFAFLVALFTLVIGTGSANADCNPSHISAVFEPIITTGAVRARDGRTIDFRAAAGLIRVGGDEELDRGLDQDQVSSATEGGVGRTTPSAVMSYVGYFAKGAPSAERPIMFIWDGGPGSSTRPMLLGSFGPVIEASPGPGGAAPPPSTLSIQPNPDTLLEVVDLVFVDAPGTGFGHLEGCSPERSFYGVNEDAAAFQRFIHRFVKVYRRQDSPVFLFGESYGTLRAAVVARKLEEAQIPVSGVILLSQDLSLDAFSDGSLSNPGTENASFLTLPSFAAAAWVHGRVPHTGDLEAWLRKVETFSMDEYAPALARGSNLPLSRKQALATQLAAYTGIPAQTWFDADLRIEASRFRNLLEADEGKLIGREDTRLEGPIPKVRTTAVEDDPTLNVWRNSVLTAFRIYVRGALGLGERPYTSDIGDVAWDMYHVTDPHAWSGTFVNTGPDLVAAMKMNPKMRVFAAGGYFDLATPYFGMPYLLDHLDLSPSLRANLSWREYPAGHSAYNDDAVRRDMHDRISDLVMR